jgi:hypothetical protein
MSAPHFSAEIVAEFKPKIFRQVNLGAIPLAKFEGSSAPATWANFEILGMLEKKSSSDLFVVKSLESNSHYLAKVLWKPETP